MKIREELFDHHDWWQAKFPIKDLDETPEEFEARVAYLKCIEPNPRAVEEGFFESKKFDYETIDEFRARIREFYLSIDMGVDEKGQDDYYRDEENIKKDMLGSQLSFNKEWYEDYLNRTSAQ